VRLADRSQVAFNGSYRRSVCGKPLRNTKASLTQLRLKTMQNHQVIRVKADWSLYCQRTNLAGAVQVDRTALIDCDMPQAQAQAGLQ
jgi:hypothetical protein